MYSPGFILCCCVYCYSLICNLFSFFFNINFPFRKPLATLSCIVIACNHCVCGWTTFLFLPAVSAIGLETPLLPLETLLEIFTYLLISSRHFKMHACMHMYMCICVCTFVHVCTRACVCVCICAYGKIKGNFQRK